MTRLAAHVVALAVLAACHQPQPTTIHARQPTRTEADPTTGIDHAMWNATTTSPPRTTTTVRPSRTRGQQAQPRATAYGVRLVSSTAYCLTGTMANGQRVYHGAAAMNGVPLGARYRVLSGPYAGRTLVVADRIGHSSQFDIAMPGDCDAARRYGRRTISVERVG